MSQAFYAPLFALLVGSFLIDLTAVMFEEWTKEANRRYRLRRRRN